MNLTRKRFSLLFLSTILLSVLVTAIVVQAATPSTTFTISSGVYPGAPSYTIYGLSGTYYAKDQNGLVEYSGTTAADIIEDAWSGMSAGGEIRLSGAIDLGTSPLEINLAKHSSTTPKGLVLTGSSPSNTKITYTGTGYAITITSTDETAGYYDVTIQNLWIDGSTKTTGRNGLKIDRVGRNALVENVFVYNMDYAFLTSGDPAEGTNEVAFRDCKAVTCNVGFANDQAATNERVYYNCQAIDTTTYGFYEYGSSDVKFYKCLAAPSGGIGFYMYATWNVLLSGFRFEGSAAYTCDLYVNGTSTYLTRSLNLDSCYFNALTYSNYAIILNSASNVTITAPQSKGHSAAFMYLTNAYNTFTLINPDIAGDPTIANADPYLLAGTCTYDETRIAGLVITNRAMGLVAMAGNTLATGDLCKWTAEGTVGPTWASNQTNIAAVMWGQATNNPVVVAISGATLVNVDCACAIGDTLISGTTAKIATVNNTSTNTKYELGISLSVTGEAGPAYVLVK